MAQQRYHVIDRIDAGGMAEVFKANSTSLQGFEKLVAIKRILPNLTKNERFVRMFLDEAKVSLHLNHTNCVQVFDLGLADGTYFIVMEFVDGVNLKNVIEALTKKKEAMPLQVATYIAIEICKGLAHAHGKLDQQGHHLAIVHRDISPPNVLISREGEVKITDFGLAKAKSQVETTDPGIVKGKFGYLSPEAAHGEDIDARTDIFAVGIVLWEMLTGERLFLGRTDLETLQQVRKNETRPLSAFRPDVPKTLESVVQKALSTEPETRYQSVKALGRDLAAFLFAYGQAVTSFDVAKMVAEVSPKHERGPSTMRDLKIQEEIQEAINRIVSLEEVDDLDSHLADVYANLPDAGADIEHAGGAFEDPRLWADVGFEDVSVRSPSEAGEDHNEDVDWQERGLGDLVRRRNTYPGGQPAIGKDVADDPTKTLDRDQFSAMVSPQLSKAAEKGAVPERVEPKNGASIEVADLPSTHLPNQRPQTAQVKAASREPKGPPTGVIIAVFLILVVAAGGVYFLLTT